jgi:chromosome segregation ATPase
LNYQLESLQNEKNQVENRSKQLAEEIEKLNREKDSSGKEVEKKQIRIDQLLLEGNNLTKTYDNLVLEYGKLQQLEKQLESRNVELVQETNQLKNTENQLRSEFKELKAQIQKSQDSIRLLQDENKLLMNQSTQTHLTTLDVKQIEGIVSTTFNQKIDPLKTSINNLKEDFDMKSIKKSISEIKFEVVKDQEKIVQHVDNLTEGTIKSFELLQNELNDQRKDMNLILDELKRISPAIQTKEPVQKETPGREDALKKQLEKMKGTLGTLRLISRPRGSMESTQSGSNETKSGRGKISKTIPEEDTMDIERQ